VPSGNSLEMGDGRTQWGLKGFAPDMGQRLAQGIGLSPGFIYLLHSRNEDVSQTFLTSYNIRVKSGRISYWLRRVPMLKRHYTHLDFDQQNAIRS